MTDATPRVILERRLKALIANTIGKDELESAIRAELAKPVEQVDPVAWMDDFGNAFPIGANKGAGSWMDAHKRSWKPLYLHPPTPAWHDAPETVALKAERDELLKDAERMDYLQKHARCDPKMDGNHVWWPTTFNQAHNLRGKTLRDAIDAAIAKAEGKSDD